MENKVPILIHEKNFYDNNYFWIIVYIADICNYNCEYCYNKKPRTNQLLNLDKLYDFIQYIKNISQKNIFLEFIGGEPTLHPNLLSFLEKTKNICSKIEILTNFSADIELYNNLLNNNTEIFASWHNSNTQFVNNAKRLKTKNITYCVMFENNNWKNSKHVFYELYNLYPESVETSLIGETDIKYSYTYEQLREYKNITDKILKYKNRYEVTYSDKSIEYKSFNDLYMNYNYNFKYWKCDAYLNHLYIHVNGDIYPCQSYYDYNANPIGNMYNIQYKEKIRFKSVICKFNTCSCTYSLKKEKILR